MTQVRETLLRSNETYQRYISKRDSDTCFMCASGEHVVIKSYEHWHVIKNNYPYDNLAEVHHLLCPIRHLSFNHPLTVEEEAELWLIKHMINKTTEYDCILENFAHGQSQPGHIHYHLLKWKPV